MATAQANQKVYVSPGVYTSETELSFVAQSVGVTTLGLVGETLKGPAFEPVFITNYDEFQTYFGGTQPTKFYGTQIPKYEAAYIAKSYLQQSNQLFVTRVLGLSGYDAGPSWSISITANVDPATIVNDTFGNPTTIWFSGNSSTGELTILSAPDWPIDLNTVYGLGDGTTSTPAADLAQISSGMVLGSIDSGTTSVWYGSLNNTDYTALIGSYPAATNVLGVNNLDFDANNLSSSENSSWFYSNFSLQGGSYSGYSWGYYIYDLVDNGGGAYEGYAGITYDTFTGDPIAEYNNMVVATVRSRGVSLYNSTSNQHGPIYEVGDTANLSLNCTGAYSGITSNPFASFQLTGTTSGTLTPSYEFSFDVSLDATSNQFITKVLGVGNFDKIRTDVPIFVEEVYENSLTWLYNMGYVRGLNCSLIALEDARSLSSTSIAWNLEQYQSPETPFLVSELRGNRVAKLFKFISISDGDAANTEVKISIANLSFTNMTFDVLVRQYADTDANPVVLEKYTNCTMDPATNNFVAKRIGSANGEYGLVSRYIMVEMAEDFPIDALPCGFYGYTQRIYDTVDNPSPYPVYKTEYYYPGQVIFNPPYGIAVGGFNVDASGDVVRRNYLGFSSQFGIDEAMLQYKGKQNPQTNWSTATDSLPWNYLSKGFHMDSGATVVLIGNEYVTSGQTAFECGVASFTSDPIDTDNPYYYIYSRKFTVCFAGGFDGWDIYREYRTNEDRFQLGSSGYLAGAAPSTRYPTATGDGLFKRIVVQNNTQDFANTDYYAYLLGILTFRNPASTNINVFATGNINYVNNLKLVENTINMVQYERADSVYITTTPDYDLLSPDGTSQYLIKYPQDAVDNLDNAVLDSNYTATYYPWILVRDTVNNTQIYLPPTGEVCRNLALTDNIAFPWFASAGYTRGLVNSVKARLKLTQEDRDTLYQGRINPIATFSDVGTVIWGNKTLQVTDSPLNRLNVRRLLLQARKLISAVAIRLLFEQNDQLVRQQFLDSVNPILDGIRRDRGLYDFRVTVSNSPEDLDSQRLTGKIYLKPTKALEFIDIEFFITPTGASFENI